MLTLLDRAERRFPEVAGFKVTQTLIDDITAELKVARANPVKIAAKYGVAPSFVRYIMNELPNPVTSFTVHSEDGWGREDIRDFIVTRKIAGNDWSQEDRKLMEDQRALYDEGVVELTQGRDGDFIIQYSIPRKKKAARLAPYFVIGEECAV